MNNLCIECHLSKVLEEEQIIKKLKDQVEIDFRLARELEQYDEMVTDPDYLKVLANRYKTYLYSAQYLSSDSN
jgi:hypothetical protein